MCMVGGCSCIEQQSTSHKVMTQGEMTEQLWFVVEKGSVEPQKRSCHPTGHGKINFQFWWEPDTVHSEHSVAMLVSREATRWRPSQLGWRPSLLVTKTFW